VHLQAVASLRRSKAFYGRPIGEPATPAPMLLARARLAIGHFAVTTRSLVKAFDYLHKRVGVAA